MLSLSKSHVTKSQLQATAYSLVAVTSVALVGRACLAVWQRQRLQVDDIILAMSYIFFLIMAILYITAASAMSRVDEIDASRATNNHGYQNDWLYVAQVVFACNFLFWLSLWSVKFVFLLLYRRLVRGIRIYSRLWWGVVAYSVLTFLGCMISNFTRCHEWKEMWTPGGCQGARDADDQQASLYYAFAADLLSDVFIIALPLQLLCRPYRSRTQWCAIAGIFILALVCVMAAIIRVIPIQTDPAQPSVPSSSWLALWGIVESSFAIITACTPRLYATLKGSHMLIGIAGDRRGHKLRTSEHSPDKLLLDGKVPNQTQHSVSSSRDIEENDIVTLNDITWPSSRIPSRATPVNGVITNPTSGTYTTPYRSKRTSSISKGWTNSMIAWADELNYNALDNPNQIRSRTPQPAYMNQSHESLLPAAPNMSQHGHIQQNMTMSNAAGNQRSRLWNESSEDITVGMRSYGPDGHVMGSAGRPFEHKERKGMVTEVQAMPKIRE